MGNGAPKLRPRNGLEGNVSTMANETKQATQLMHAPAPWRYAYGEVSDIDGEQVALLPLRKESEAEINGRLIAAAPDLLEALMPFASSSNLISCGVSYCSRNERNRDRTDVTLCMWCQAKAAIEKATGAQS